MVVIGIIRYGLRVILGVVVIIILIMVIILQRGWWLSCGSRSSIWRGSRGQVDTEWIEGGRRGVGVGFETVVEEIVIVVVSCGVSGGGRSGRWGVRCRCRRW